jgi:hypothetical protein
MHRYGRLYAIVYLVPALGLAGFQAALALGAPWGHLAMGGAFPGSFPPALRVAAIAQGALILWFAGVVGARAGLWRHWALPPRAIGAVIGFGVLALIANLATPSAAERDLWAPVAALMLASALGVWWLSRGRNAPRNPAE